MMAAIDGHTDDDMTATSEESDDSDPDFDYLEERDDRDDNAFRDHQLFIDSIKDFGAKCRKMNYIQHNVETTGVKIEHTVLVDDECADSDPNETFHFTNGYIFTPKSGLAERSKQRADDSQPNAGSLSKAHEIIENHVMIDEIPHSFQQFLLTIFNMNAVNLDKIDSKIKFKNSYNYENKYENHESYVNVMITRVVESVWSSLKACRQSKTKEDYRELCFQLTDSKEHFNYLKTIHMYAIRRSDVCEFSYGQMITLTYLNDESCESQPKTPVFGFIQSIKSQLLNDNSKCVELFKSDKDLPQTDSIVDEIEVLCNNVSPNCDKVSVLALNCVQSYLIQARIVYGLQKFSICQQILVPIHEFAITGLSVSAEREINCKIKFYNDQLEAIQKAYDCSVLEDSKASNFVAIYGPKNSGKTAVLGETLLHILKYGEMRKVSKLLAVVKNRDHISSIISLLKKHNVSVFHINNKEEKCLSHKKKHIGRAIRHLKTDLHISKLISNNFDLYHECIDFYADKSETIKLSPKAKLLNEGLKALAIENLIIDSQVIIGDIDSIFNNEEFNKSFNSGANVIKMALVDDAQCFTEPEILTLLFAGVEKIVFYGDIQEKKELHSFFKRYVLLFNTRRYTMNKCSNDNKSVVQFRGSIEDRKNADSKKNYHKQQQKYSNHKNTSFKFEKNSQRNGFAKYNSDKRKTSIYKHNRRFNYDIKSEKTDDKSGLQANISDLQNIQLNQTSNYATNNDASDSKYNAIYGNYSMASEALNFDSKIAYGNRLSYFDNSLNANHSAHSSQFDSYK